MLQVNLLHVTVIFMLSFSEVEIIHEHLLFCRQLSVDDFVHLNV